MAPVPMQYIPRSFAITKYEFHSLLRAWLRDTDDATVGPADVAPTTPWVHVRAGFKVFGLHAETARPAVERYLALLDRYGDVLEWVIHKPERRGPVVIAYGPDGDRVDSFALYPA
jgi:hypothetical protein